MTNEHKVKKAVKVSSYSMQPTPVFILLKMKSYICRLVSIYKLITENNSWLNRNWKGNPCNWFIPRVSILRFGFILQTYFQKMLFSCFLYISGTKCGEHAEIKRKGLSIQNYAFEIGVFLFNTMIWNTFKRNVWAMSWSSTKPLLKP